MNREESKFWQNQLKTGFHAIGDVDRIESHSTSLGRPDVNICLNPSINWDIELKYSDNGKVHLRPSQRGWFSRRRRVRANALVLTKAIINGQAVYFINMIDKIPDGDRIDDWINLAHIVWDGKIDFGELEGILRETECWKT